MWDPKTNTAWRSSHELTVKVNILFYYDVKAVFQSACPLFSQRVLVSVALRRVDWGLAERVPPFARSQNSGAEGGEEAGTGLEVPA